MKKIIALIAVAIMALMGTCALSEDVKGAFEDGNYVIRIPAKDDGCPMSAKLFLFPCQVAPYPIHLLTCLFLSLS